ncbi:hypothetical protein [Bradyrhizobium yuanmingense]|uniref:hypothetical protein n=1 Tax=Bradyrhizobium yuanmingense TaxID=108015 RepID=UPI0023B96EED|nr:hypothetical protein [Bradyrhizobium yuanmingense]MDF0495634.1 hypothetical protein [Bradyrhizobium yuanmingense]MDF0581701.1 hypothetical protein [Bradyrhizobium yuanmingense]
MKTGRELARTKIPKWAGIGRNSENEKSQKRAKAACSWILQQGMLDDDIKGVRVQDFVNREWRCFDQKAAHRER